MAIDQIITGIAVSSSTDDNKVPVYDAATDTFLMETPSGGAQTASVTLTNTQVNALNGTPQTLLAAQGSLKMIVPINLVIFYDYGSAAFDTSGGIEIGYNSNGSTSFSGDGPSLSISTADTVLIQDFRNSFFGTNGSLQIASSSLFNQPITIFNQNTNYTGGTGTTMKFTLSYYVIDYN